MDAVDRKILDLLQQDATLPVAELAEQVGISAAPCWRRVKKLEASGVSGAGSPWWIAARSTSPPRCSWP